MPAARTPASRDASPPLINASAAKRAAGERAVSPDSEWLLTDGRGGYGCGTAAGVPMRRYHGLWVTRTEGTAERHMIVSGLDERVGPARQLGPEEVRFAHVMPAHWQDQAEASAGDGETSFARRPLPAWTHQTENGVLERTVALRRQAPGQAPALLVRWRNASPEPIRLEVRALLGWCNVDHLPPVNEDFDGTLHARGASWGFRPTDELPHLWLSVDGISAFRSEPVWYRNFLYSADRLRGYDHVGHRWSPGILELDLPPGGEATASFALGEPCADAGAAFDVVAAEAEQQWRAAVQSKHALADTLALGADDFLYRGVGNRLGVLAGFPWFGEWGRDVFLALPGLTLARGQVAQCAEVMTGCLPFLREGLLPNIYKSDVATSNYGSCDAALWFALAAMRFADAGHDPDLVQQQLLPAMRSIAEAYERGTDLGLKVAANGLLQAGRKDLNATWMDARTSKGPVTPREGLPVEIQAVWYALLAYLAEQPDAERSSGEPFAKLRDRCGKAFVKEFWMADVKSLADRVHDGDPDPSIRPNMLVAAAMKRSPLTGLQRQGVVKMAKAHLVTPCGMRTLSPSDSKYIGIYGGGLEGRDNAYHQGTVWPWPAGFFVEAALRAAPKKSRQKEATALLQWLEELLHTEMARAGLGHVSEVFDGDLPHRPGGTFAQAWNTGELLRAHVLCRAVMGGTAIDSTSQEIS
ncbi:MAG: putative glycogen debranching enzyme [Planctomycetota bacterium]|jgi:predicted glycogen debranching enzyme